MGIMGQKEDQGKVEEEIKILSTNLEVLNQMLVKDPRLAAATGGAVGGGMSPQQYQSIVDYVKALNVKIDKYDSAIKELLTHELADVKGALKSLSTFAGALPAQARELDIVVKRLNRMIEMFETADKATMASLANQLSAFNTNTASLDENMKFFQQKLVETINFRINEVGNVVSNRLARTGLVGIGIFVLVGTLFLIISGMIGG